MNEELREEIKKYLKENLRISVSDRTCSIGYGYDSDEKTLEVNILLEEEVIASDTFYA